MSNIKEVDIEGLVPYNAGDDKDLIHQLGILNLPSFGIKIRYGRAHYYRAYSGGKIAMYEYLIVGVEAVRAVWIENLIELLSHQGPISKAMWRDTEERSAWVSVMDLATKSQKWKSWYTP